MTLILDLTHTEQRVHLGRAGFKSCVITPPNVLSELRLARSYRRPNRTRAPVFVDELLSLSVEPALSCGQARALTADERARLRLALVAAYGCERDWRALYGSHLSADERLFAVMYWRWRNHRASLRRFTEANRTQVTSAASSAALRALKAREVPAPGAAAIAKRYESPALRMFQHLDKLTAIVNVSERITALTRPLGIAAAMTRPLGNGHRGALGAATALGGIGAREGIDGRLATASARSSGIAASNSLRALGFGRDFGAGSICHLPYAGVDTSAAGVLSGRLGTDVLKLTDGRRPLAWQAPAGLADILGRWEKNLSAAQALTGVRIHSPLLPPPWIGQLTAASKALQSLDVLTEPFRELTEAMEVVERFERRWQNEALYFVISGLLAVCNVWQVSALAALDPEGVEAAVLLALEMVATGQAFIPALREQIARAPYLNEYQRVTLDHALEHAADGEYMKACPGIYVGLEGAFWQAGYAREIVTAERKDKRNTNKDIGFESMVKLLSLEPEFKTFVVRGVYSTVGNPYRHGGDAADTRRQVLLGVAALAGWFEEFAGVQALTALVTRTGRALPQAIESVLGGPTLLNP